MTKLIKKVGTAMLILCYIMSMYSCGNNSGGAKTAADEPDIVAKKYVDAYYFADLANFLDYSVSDLDSDTIIKVSVEVFEEAGKTDTDLSQKLIERLGTDDYEKAVIKAYDMLKERWQNCEINISVVKQNYYGKDEVDDVVSDFNDDINDIMAGVSGSFAGYKEIFSSLLVDPNEVESACKVNVEVKMDSYDNSMDEFDMYLINVDGQWKVIESEMFLVMVAWGPEIIY